MTKLAVKDASRIMHANKPFGKFAPEVHHPVRKAAATAQSYLEKARRYKDFTREPVPELDTFIEATAARAAFVQGKTEEARGYAESAQQTALTLTGTTSEMANYLLYVAELSLQIASHQAGS